MGSMRLLAPHPQPDPQFFSLPLDTTSPPRVQRGPHLLPSEGLPRSPCLYSPSLEVVWKLPQAQPQPLSLVCPSPRQVLMGSEACWVQTCGAAESEAVQPSPTQTDLGVPAVPPGPMARPIKGGFGSLRAPEVSAHLRLARPTSLPATITALAVVLGSWPVAEAENRHAAWGGWPCFLGDRHHGEEPTPKPPLGAPRLSGHAPSPPREQRGRRGRPRRAWAGLIAHTAPWLAHPVGWFPAWGGPGPISSDERQVVAVKSQHPQQCHQSLPRSPGPSCPSQRWPRVAPRQLSPIFTYITKQELPKVAFICF